jgi:single-strand DNA-binding protein
VILIRVLPEDYFHRDENNIITTTPFRNKNTNFLIYDNLILTYNPSESCDSSDSFDPFDSLTLFDCFLTHFDMLFSFTPIISPSNNYAIICIICNILSPRPKRVLLLFVETVNCPTKQFLSTTLNLLSMIKLQVIGNLGKDCVTNNVNGKTVMNFTVAHTEKFRDAQGNQKDKTIWVDCAYWSDRTGIAPYLRKGQQVYVEGIPDLRTYTKNDGSFGATLSLRVLSIQLLGGRPENAGGGGGYAGGETSYSAPKSNAGVASGSGVNEPVDDLPF